MLQRIQSFFLVLYIIISIINYFYSPNNVLILIEFFEEKLSIFQISSFLGFLITTIAFFSFKDRNKQFVLVKIAIAFHFFQILMVFYYLLNIKNDFILNIQDLIVVLYFMGIALLILALKYIKKDIDLIESTNRIR
tara:strand:+ start:874 stop:1281 length:408 start_codon:yes stop_codon:yes gene_type:complete